jgi:hypothetical protein
MTKMLVRRKLLVWVLVLVMAIVVGAFVAWKLKTPESRSATNAEPSQAPGQKPTSDAVVFTASSSSAPIFNDTRIPNDFMQSPLPSPRMTLGEIYPTLVQSANAGDHRASCRLGMEFSKCALAPSLLADYTAQLRFSSLPKKLEANTNETAEQFKLRQEQAERVRRINYEQRLKRVEEARLRLAECERFQDNADLVAVEWLIKAAKAGNSFAQARLVSNEDWLPHAAIARPELMREFLTLAPKMLHGLADAGREEAARKLAAIYSPYALPSRKSSWLSNVIKPDPVLGSTYLRLAHLLELKKSPAFYSVIMPEQGAKQMGFLEQHQADERIAFEAAMSNEQVAASEVLAQEKFAAAYSMLDARMKHAQQQFKRFATDPGDAVFIRSCEVLDPSID